MAFWSSPGVSPKRQYRWVMNMGGVPQWLIKKVKKPGFNITEATHKYLNHTFYYPGRVEYEPSAITLVDPIDPDATAIMMGILQGAGYMIPTDANSRQTISKKNATAALGNVLISQIGAEGDIVDQFTFVNAWLSKADFGELDYESDNLLDISIEIRYDFVTMPIKGGRDGFDPTPYVGETTTGPGRITDGRSVFSTEG